MDGRGEGGGRLVAELRMWSDGTFLTLLGISVDEKEMRTDRLPPSRPAHPPTHPRVEPKGQTVCLLEESETLGGIHI